MSRSNKLEEDTNILSSMGLKTAKFMNGIHVARTLIADKINYSSTVKIKEKKLQITLNDIAKWSDIHEMTVNTGKCGVISVKCALSARTRAFGKWASLRTWISDLIKCPYKHRCDTWVSGCTRWIKKYNGNINTIKNTIETLNNRIQKNDKSQISKWIAASDAGTSCNCMELEPAYPELKAHINYAFKNKNSDTEQQGIMQN
ncbi:hypothetical protein BB561_004991 [Smittium simulii]|uniref:Uncharacterized protein n=1 Tax=Smittium simulii TaxID=133385 RepID=A0A2T9YCY0_9FUNG|nr:hypothetical protein BB561_004991 [Smittium simulii]